MEINFIKTTFQINYGWTISLPRRGVFYGKEKNKLTLIKFLIIAIRIILNLFGKGNREKKDPFCFPIFNFNFSLYRVHGGINSTLNFMI